jgi:hypothetical protein
MSMMGGPKCMLNADNQMGNFIIVSNVRFSATAGIHGMVPAYVDMCTFQNLPNMSGSGLSVQWLLKHAER